MRSVSVIIPVYNMEKYIRSCLDSVFNQTLENIEVICIDDGSTDMTLEILDEYQKKHDNLLVRHQERKGAGPARNWGLQLASGEYIAFMDSDDYYPADDVLENLYKEGMNNEASIVGGNILKDLDDKVPSYDGNHPKFELTGRIATIQEYQNPYGYQRFIFRRRLLEDNKIVFPDLVRHQDPPFLLEAMITAGKICQINKPVYVFRIFDKKVDFLSKRVVLDIMRGYLIMMKMAREAGLYLTQKILLERIKNQAETFVFHICNGNRELASIIRETGENILDEQSHKDFNDSWTDERIAEEYNKKLSILEGIDNLLLGYREIIIYGAGEYAKSFYDYISSKMIEFIGFGVSRKPANGKARNHAINDIRDYVSYKDTALVVIAIKEDVDNQMESLAKDLGYKNIYVMNHLIGCYESKEITEGKFAYDN